MRTLFLHSMILAACVSSIGCKRDAEPAPQATASAIPKPSEVRAADGMPVEIPTKRTPAPTLAEWDKAPPLREPTAAAARCVIKVVREWVRVDCSGERSPGGTPNGVEPQPGCPRDTYASMKTHANLVTALSPGHRCEIVFSWTGTKQTFVAEWAGGTKRPTLAFAEAAWTQQKAR